MHHDAPLRRITTWLAILGYALVVSGLPLPMAGPSGSRPDAAVKRLAGKDRSRPFPCMDKPCGCATADQCFTRCCCNTPAETLAWAKAHAVEPAVLVALEHRVAGDGPAAPEVEKSACCSSKARAVEESCCAPTLADAVVFDEESPCSEYKWLAAAPARNAAPACHDESPVDDQPSSPQPRPHSVTLRAMLACGGIVAEWFAAGAALPPLRVELVLAPALPDVCTPVDDACESPASSPAAPPPRAA